VGPIDGKKGGMGGAGLHWMVAWPGAEPRSPPEARFLEPASVSALSRRRRFRVFGDSREAFFSCDHARV
jgi:hypothetical protein